MIKKELILEGLDCANCAAKIEREVNELNGVKASMNFITKTLALELDSESGYAELLEAVRAIVRKHEPDVVVSEKPSGKSIRRTLVLEGLCCANCAAKIESEVGRLDGVAGASVDFLSKKLTMDIVDKNEADRITTEATAIVKKIEPDVKVAIEEETSSGRAQAASKSGSGSKNRKQLARLAAGGAIFAVALAFDFDSWLELALFLTSYVIVGADVVMRAAKGIIRGQVFSENFLMSVATIGAFLVGEYPEGVAVMLFYLIGEMFQDRAVDHSRRSISDLMDIRPDYANLKEGDILKKVSPEDVSIGDIILVKPGEKVPLDGKVVSGTSMADTSALTGESVPRRLGPGDDALSGFINVNGALTIQVTKEYGESTVAKILDLVQNASSRKAPTEQFITKFARYYTPAVTFGALAIAVVPPLVVPGATFSEWVYRALVFLVISCPCALVISIPLGFFGGIGGASKRGILLKGSNYLEALNSVETVVFDKTGTLTKGVFKVTDISPQSSFSEQELLQHAAYAESFSNHPIALSIVDSYGQEIDKSSVEGYEEIAGHGVRAIVNGKEILAGNARLMESEKIQCDEIKTLGTAVHVAVDKKYAGSIVISDQLKEDAADAVRDLKALGVARIVMLTGDHRAVADDIGVSLGIDEVYSELLPADKVEKLESLDKSKSRKGKIVFVGDGINDAPVLARADIGIAMGGLGSDAAIEAADVVIMTDEPSKIVTAIRIAKRTRKIVYQNILFALGVKGIFLALGAFGVATMWEAVFADVGVAVIAIFNAMRVLNTKDVK